MAAERKVQKRVVDWRHPLVAVRTPGSRVRARGVGKTASKSVWLFRKLAGPVKVKIGLAPRVNRQSLFKMVGVVLVVQACKGRPLNRLRALTGVAASMHDGICVKSGW